MLELIPGKSWIYSVLLGKWVRKGVALILGDCLAHRHTESKLLIACF